jgi:cell wall-associated NlpC family hydrolase
VLLLVAAAVAAGSGDAQAAPPVRRVAVSVATLWVQPGHTRAVDRPSLTNPVHVDRWLAGMSTADRRWLVGRLETQATYGTKVTVLGTRGAWSHVAVAGQPTPRNPRGYPGWLPTRQLTRTTPLATQRLATVTVPHAMLWAHRGSARRFDVSYDTDLPVVSSDAVWLRVALLDGTRAFVRRGDVVLRRAAGRDPGAAVVRDARRFRGVMYLWAGTSGYGFDCSGLTHSVFDRLGITIPRDADAQFHGGRAIARTALAPGDLVFLRNARGVIHHVAIYVGGGKVIDSLRTGTPIAERSLRSPPYSVEYAGARRYW